MADATEKARETIRRLPALMEADGDLARRARRLAAEMLLAAGEDEFRLVFRDGQIADLVEGPVLMRSFDFAIRATPEGWVEHWRPMPRPPFHDILGMAKHGHLSMAGDLHPLMSHLQVVKDVLALPRAAAEAAP